MSTETVKQEAERRGISIGQVRKERQTRPEAQPDPALHLEVGKKYIDGFGSIITIVEKDAKRPYCYIGDNKSRYDEHGLWSDSEHVHLRKFRLIREIA